MADPNWNDGFYYDGSPPHTGLKLARREHPAASSFYFPILLTSVYPMFGRLLDIPAHIYRDRHDNVPLRAGVGHPFWSAAASFPRVS